MPANVPMTAIGKAIDGINVALTRRRKNEDHANHERAGYEKSDLNIVDGASDGLAAVVEDLHLDDAGSCAGIAGSHA